MAESGNKKKSGSSSQNIKVVVRVRPLNNEEKEQRVRTVVQCVSMREIQTKEKKYCFDRVFEPDSCQMDVYSFVVAPMIGDVLAGYNCTVFAYGQTGTGKTHTMTGGDPSLSSNSHWKEDALAGCIPRAAANIFDELGSMKINDYNVRVSFLELYNEEVRDLLSQQERSAPLSIFNDSKGSVCIQNLNEVTVFNSNDIYMLLQQGTFKRQTAATLMNSHSSRSHTVFTITVHTREANVAGEEVLKTGKINLVDLAGSENIVKSGAKDKRVQEMANINKSLLTLGRVIQILAEKNNKHVPYRDSKLTRILQDSLGGHTKTCIIATVSPSHKSYEETQSTLEYACRARDIRNTPMVNEKITKAQLMKEMTHEIEKLKKDLDAARAGDGFFIDRSNWDELNSQLQSSSNALTLKNEIIDDMKRKLSDLETIRDIKKKEFEEVMNVCQKREKMIDRAKALLREQRLSLKQEQYLSRCYLEAATENNLKAKELLEVTKNLSRNQDILQKKLENQYYNNYTNEKTINEKSTQLNKNLSLAMSNLEILRDATSASCANHKINLSDVKSKSEEFGMKSKMKLEQEVRSLVDSEFDRHSKLIRDSVQVRAEGVDMVKRKVDDMSVLVNGITDCCSAAYKNFEQWDQSKSSKISAMEALFISIQTDLLNMKKKKLEALHDLERLAFIRREEISDIDALYNTMEKSKTSWSSSKASVDDPDEEIKVIKNLNEIQHNSQLLCKDLQSAKEDLSLHSESYEVYTDHLISSTQEMKKNVEQVMSDTTDTTEAFVRSNSLQLNALEENISRFENSVDDQVSELKTILHSTEEVGKELVTKVIIVKRSGDTPKQNCLNYPKRIGEGAISRDVLIKRFREECNEDLENESFHLNVSTESVEPLHDPIEKSSSNEYLDYS